MHAVRYCTLCPDEGGGAHQRAGMNGAGVHALAGTSDERLAAGFRRSDCVRLITQCLQGLGYNGAASRLEEDSGILLLAQPVSRFRQGVLEGQWRDMDALVDDMQLHPNCRARVCFLIYRQKYLELLEAGCSAEALRCLREQLAPLQAHITAHEPAGSPAGAVEHSELGELSCYLMCGHVEELKRRASWDGAQGSSRQMLLQELQRHIPPSLLLPDNRLLTLLQQAVLWQTSQGFDQQSFCTSSSSSLFEDFSCSRNVIPRETHHTLEKHSDEVWYVQFSHNGELLASASKDSMVIVWDVRRGEMTHLVVRPCPAASTCARNRRTPPSTLLRAAAREATPPYRLHHTPQIATRPFHLCWPQVLVGHTDSLSFVAWSPDDSQLLTCGNDRLLKLWQVSAPARTLSITLVPFQAPT